MSSLGDISSWPARIRILALTIEVSQARIWAEEVRQDDCEDTEFAQSQLDERLYDVRRLLASLGPHSSSPIVAIANSFVHALASVSDKPSEGLWPESNNLRQIIHRELRVGLPPAPLDQRDWARRTDLIGGRSWIGHHARSCPAGWVPLLERAVSQAELCIDSAALSECQTNQIKEKFGTLRWYAGSDALLSVITDFAELASALTCLVCGAEGELRSDRSWMLTLCDKHDEVDRGSDPLALSRLAYPNDR